MFKQISKVTVDKVTTIVEAYEVVDIGVVLHTVTVGVSEALLLIPEAKLNEEADGTFKIVMRWR
jgi:hypothetical protein